MVKNYIARLLALCGATLFCHLPSAQAETVLLDFSSTSCGPCQQMRPVVQQLANAGYNVREVNIHRDPQAAAQFGVTQVPTFVVLVDGRETERVIGLTSFTELQELLTRGNPRPTVSPIAVGVGANPVVQNDDLAKPQAGRIVEIQEPTRPFERQLAPTSK